MTKHFGYEPGDFHVEDRLRSNGLATRLLPKLVDFMLPVALGLLALYIGRYGFGA
jgi:hypothetical protein